MCGIFGIIAKENNNYSPDFIKDTLSSLAILSETRGKDSSGIAISNSEGISVIKGAIPVSRLLKTNIYSEKIEKNIFNNREIVVFGHSRLVTNGSQLDDNNNQPIIKDGIIAIHNGIIVNEQSLWDKHPELAREYKIDTEIFLSLVRHFLKEGNSIQKSVINAFKEIKGTASLAFTFSDYRNFVLATNNGSLYILTNFSDILFFASESIMLKTLADKKGLYQKIEGLKILQVLPEEGYNIGLDNFNIQKFDFKGDTISSDSKREKTVAIQCENVPAGKNNNRSIIVDIEKFRYDSKSDQHLKLLEYNIREINNLKRCTKCVLPETFPFIHFDEQGVCNYCNNYVQKNQPKSLEELKSLVAPYKHTDGSPDVLVPLSGGRDSTFVLHYVKNELGLTPVAYTYDWGMVTDLARRNIARVCGKLQIENIIVAADINKKRRNIRNNILAWLKKPSLGMIPLFMAGDKQFFMYANKVKKQTGIDLNIWGINFLENTDFKVGFCGVPPDWDKELIYSMNIKRQLKLYGYVSKNILSNPAYINSSVLDTIESFLSRYTNPRKDYYHFFDYYRWDEKEIEDLIINEYDWELATDLKSTWRIGDGTASFYNYIYYTVAGFSENDTFKSNMIREGMISREEALKKIEEENKPRFESIKWYLEIVGLDFETVINRINQIPKLYRQL